MATKVPSTTAGAQHVETAPAVQDVENPLTDSDSVQEWKRIKQDADLATKDEHSMTFATAVKRYPKAVAWSMVVSMCIIMDGYDTALMSSLFAFPAFQKKYGHQIGDTGKYQLTGPWQMALGMGVPVGNMFGIFINGYLTDRYGHKLVLNAALVVLMGLIFIQFFAQNIESLFVGQLLCVSSPSLPLPLSSNPFLQDDPKMLTPQIREYRGVCSQPLLRRLLPKSCRSHCALISRPGSSPAGALGSFSLTQCSLALTPGTTTGHTVFPLACNGHWRL